VHQHTLISSHHPTVGSTLPPLAPIARQEAFTMPNKALSDCVKRQHQSQNKEETMAKAVEAYTAEQAKTSSQKGARTIAREYGIENQWRTIVNRYDGGRSIHDKAGHECGLPTSFMSQLVGKLMSIATRGCDIL
jgi:hypothetical protein